MRFFHTSLLVFLAVSFTQASELKLLPETIDLTNPNAKQRLVVVEMADGKIIADRTSQAKFNGSNTEVATVDKDGFVHVVGDGNAVITAKINGMSATANVTVKNSQKPFTWSFRNHVIPVMTKLGCNSGACHGALAGKGGLKLSLRGYAPDEDHFVLTRQANSRRVNLLQPNQSLMLRKPTLAIEHGGGQKLMVDSPEFALLADWIATGAPGPKSEDARIEKLEVFPKSALLKPKQSLQIVVRAWYDDGTSQDVTRWAKFASTEDLVASVDDDGKVSASGHGEASITVLYSNLVALTRIASPFENDLKPEVFTKAKRANFVDNLILDKLQALNIPPSPTCEDEVFLRRAYLDAAGILPTTDEVKQFLANKSPNKRTEVIESLLKRSEFVDYWAYKWSDVFLVSSRKLKDPAMWAFYQHIRQSVSDNKAWDQFAREIITAQGSNLDNGAANYFAMHTDITDLTETTAVTFLGMSVTCCRCHNHPMEKWTQDQYWSFANLFSRVGRKNGNRDGEILIQSQPIGNVLHLKKGEAMSPAPLDAEPLSLKSTKSRRKYFADWLTDKDNPYFAKALVNRVWKNFMGRGLVEAEDDLRQTNPPSNPELLDALARDFIEHKFNVKHLIRTIMNSAAYQRSSVPLPGNVADDRFYSRYIVRRLAAEVVLDAYSQVTGVPTEFTQLQLGPSGGFKKIALYPKGTRALQLPDTLVVSQFLESFGRPERSQACSCERQDNSTVSQALHLNNGNTLNDRLRDKKCVVSDWLKEKISNKDAVQRVFLLALSRSPSKSEEQRLIALMQKAEREPTITRRQVLEDLCWAVLTGQEFLFNH